MRLAPVAISGIANAKMNTDGLHGRVAAVLEVAGFRTDRGDDEGDDDWGHQQVSGESDRKGDDDVEVKITSAGAVTVTQ